MPQTSRDGHAVPPEHRSHGAGLFGGYVVYDLYVILDLLTLKKALSVSMQDRKHFYFAFSKALSPHGPRVSLFIERATGAVMKGVDDIKQPHARSIAKNWMELMEYWVDSLERKQHSVVEHPLLGPMIERFRNGDAMGSDATTRGIRIGVSVLHIPEMNHRANRGDGEEWFAYRVTITFEGDSDMRATLLTRTWYVMDEEGKVTSQVLRQPGVIGLYPVVYSGMDPFHYVSQSCTSGRRGSMRGSFEFQVDGSGERFDATVAEFTFDSKFCAA
eukprot:g82469.t1